MREIVSPAKAIQGMVTLPGDKSISHRYGMLASIAEGVSTIANYSTGADCQSTLACMAALGARIERDAENRVVIHGGALREPSGRLDAGNSGLDHPHAQRDSGGAAVYILDRRRRIAVPPPHGSRDQAAHRRWAPALTHATDTYPPLTIHGRPLHGIDYALPMASAQVKSCVLLAGLFAEGDTIVREPVRTRDHTEIALREFGADIATEKRVITLRSGARLTGRELFVPGDLSSACFFLVAALLMQESDLVIHGVGLNPTRSALLDFLVSMGAADQGAGRAPDRRAS